MLVAPVLFIHILWDECSFVYMYDMIIYRQLCDELRIRRQVSLITGLHSNLHLILYTEKKQMIYDQIYYNFMDK